MYIYLVEHAIRAVRSRCGTTLARLQATTLQIYTSGRSYAKSHRARHILSLLTYTAPLSDRIPRLYMCSGAQLRKVVESGTPCGRRPTAAVASIAADFAMQMLSLDRAVPVYDCARAFAIMQLNSIVLPNIFDRPYDRGLSKVDADKSR